MIRCECGEFFGKGCQHAEHKKISGYPGEHRIVCSGCGEYFSSYPLPKVGVHVAYTSEGDIVWTLCDKCMEEKQSVAVDQIDAIIAYESGELTEIELLNLFQDLITSGLAWSLQGHYGRVASDLIKNGWCFVQLEWKGEYSHAEN